MNEKYLRKLQQDMLLKNLTLGTRKDYFYYVKRFLDFTNKEAMTITLYSGYFYPYLLPKPL